MSCKCKTLKGTLCKNKAKEGSVYCSRHQKCVKSPAAKAVKKVSAKKAKVTNTRPGTKWSPLKDVGGGKVSKSVFAKNKKVFAKLKAEAKRKVEERTYITGTKDTEIL